MIESFTITNHLGESLDLILAEPEKSGLAVVSVEGLGQVDANVKLTKLAGSDYSTKNVVNLKDRNIIFTIKYYGDDAEECRNKADRIFPTKKTVQIVINTTHKKLMCSGIVERNEPAIFSSDSGCQVSILCPDPYLYEINPAVIPFGGIEPLLEFPIPIEEGETDEWESFEVGNIRTIFEKSIYYTGEAEVGITIVIDAFDTVRNLVFYKLETGEQIALNDTKIAAITGNTSIKAGDHIEISTNKGSKKYATLTRAGTTYNIINALGRPIDWFELVRGDNPFAYSADEGIYDMDITIQHKVAYKGI